MQQSFRVFHILKKLQTLDDLLKILTDTVCRSASVTTRHLKIDKSFYRLC